ncbi:unnamed protein product [Musa textilis]
MERIHHPTISPSDVKASSPIVTTRPIISSVIIRAHLFDHLRSWFLDGSFFPSFLDFEEPKWPGFLKPRIALVHGMICMGGALAGKVIEFPAGERLSAACDDLFIHQRCDMGDFLSLHRQSAEVHRSRYLGVCIWSILPTK